MNNFEIDTYQAVYDNRIENQFCRKRTVNDFYKEIVFPYKYNLQ